MGSQPILMPKLGLTMTEGMLSEWKVAPGDAVTAGDVIFVVETDKISNEVEAQADGTVVALHVAEGETLPVGAVLATLAVTGAGDPPRGGEVAGRSPDGGDFPLDACTATEKCPLHHPAGGPPPRAGEDRVHIVATPLARRMAARAGLDLARIAGSGPRGRIVADDVAKIGGAGVTRGLRQAQSERMGVQNSEAPDSDQSNLVRRIEARGPTRLTPARPELVEGPALTLTPLTPYQRTTAKRLTEAKRDIPHFYVQADADVTDLLHLREQLNADGGHAKLTVSHFLITALVRALAATPAISRVWADDHLRPLPTIDVGIAVEAPRGLVAPVLRDLGGATLDEIAVAADALVERARAGRLSAEDLAGGATSISNVGMFGAKALVPIVNPGQSSILGVGAAQPVFRPDANGAPVLRRMLTLTLSCDHRVIDGALAARFLAALVRGLESPAGLLRRPPQESRP